MSNREEALKLAPSGAKDRLGGFIQEVLPSVNDYRIATFIWEPDCGISEAKGIIFLLHGILGHTMFEWLASDTDNHRVLLKGSVVEKLLDLDFVVIAHDHPGHGRSSGLHAYVENFDIMRDIAIHVVESFKKREDLSGKKTFLLGMSMGGTTAIRICAKKPDLFDAVALISPAVRPPDDMFGAYGQFLMLIRPILGMLLPKLPVLKLPPSPDPVIRDAVEKDGLICRTPLRVQMGMEFLRVYTEINDIAHTLHFNKVAIFIGAEDHIVSPSGIKAFVERIQSEDKKMFVYDNITHEVFREPGCDRAIAEFLDWVKERL